MTEFISRNCGKEGYEIIIKTGSTGVACVNTNRHFIGIELDKGYFEIAVRRIEERREQAND